MGCAASTSSASSALSSAASIPEHVPSAEAEANTSLIVLPPHLSGTQSQRNKLRLRASQDKKRRDSLNFGVAAAAAAAAREKEKEAQSWAQLVAQAANSGGSGGGALSNSGEYTPEEAAALHAATLEAAFAAENVRTAAAAAAAASANGRDDSSSSSSGSSSSSSSDGDDDGDPTAAARDAGDPGGGGSALAATGGDSFDDDDDDESESDDEDDDEEESMDEIAEESRARPIDEGPLMSPPMGGPHRTLAPVGSSANLAAASPAIGSHSRLARSSTLAQLLKQFSPARCHILLVDDDARSQEIVARWLEHKKYHVTCCDDGEEAIELLQAASSSSSSSAAAADATAAGAVVTPTTPGDTGSHGAVADGSPAAVGDSSSFSLAASASASPSAASPSASAPPSDFDLILCESSMESPSGQPLLEWILRSPAHSSIPVLLMSGDATSQAEDRSLRRGAEDFLRKPLQRGLLLKTLRAVLEARIEKANAQRLKAWGDRYKNQLLAEKRHNALRLGGGGQTGGSGGHSPGGAAAGAGGSSRRRPSASSHRRNDTALSLVGTSPSKGEFVASDDATIVDVESHSVQPDPLLIAPPRRTLSIHLPPQDVSPRHGGNSFHAAPSPSMLSRGYTARNLGSSVVTPGGSSLQLETPNAGNEADAPSLQEATVLLIDPSDSTRASLAQWLASINHKLVLRNSLEEALAFVQSAVAAAAATASPSVSTASAAAAARTWTLQHHSSSSAAEAKDALSGGEAPSSPVVALENFMMPSPSPPASSRASLRLSLQDGDSSSAFAHLMGGGITAGGVVATAFSTRTHNTTTATLHLPMVSPSLGPRRTSSGAGSSSTGSHAAPVCDLIIADAEPDVPAGGHSGGASSATLTGASFMSALSSHPATASIPVILLYSSLSSPDVSPSLAGGASTILVKPVSREMLLRKVNQILSVQAQRRVVAQFGERAQAYRAILAAFRCQREEDIRLGKRHSPAGASRTLSAQKMLNSTRNTLQAVEMAHALAAAAAAAGNSSASSAQQQQQQKQRVLGVTVSSHSPLAAARSDAVNNHSPSSRKRGLSKRSERALAAAGGGGGGSPLKSPSSRCSPANAATAAARHSPLVKTVVAAAAGGAVPPPLNLLVSKSAEDEAKSAVPLVDAAQASVALPLATSDATASSAGALPQRPPQHVGVKRNTSATFTFDAAAPAGSIQPRAPEGGGTPSRRGSLELGAVAAAPMNAPGVASPPPVVTVAVAQPPPTPMSPRRVSAPRTIPAPMTVLASPPAKLPLIKSASSSSPSSVGVSAAAPQQPAAVVAPLSTLPSIPGASPAHGTAPLRQPSPSPSPRIVIVPKQSSSPLMQPQPSPARQPTPPAATVLILSPAARRPTPPLTAPPPTASLQQQQVAPLALEPRPPASVAPPAAASLSRASSAKLRLLRDESGEASVQGVSAVQLANHTTDEKE